MRAHLSDRGRLHFCAQGLRIVAQNSLNLFRRIDEAVAGSHRPDPGPVLFLNHFASRLDIPFIGRKAARIIRSEAMIPARHVDVVMRDPR